MDITQRLMDTDPTLILHNEGNWNAPADRSLPGYTSFNDAGVETETGEFLYAMVRMLKPDYVLETGSHIGVGAAYLGTALKDNKQGHLDTIEFLPELQKQTVARISRLGLNQYVTSHFGDVAKFEVPKSWRGSDASAQLDGTPQPHIKYQLIFLDTEPQTRFAEMEKFWDALEDGGFLFIHDLHRHMHQIPNEEHGFAWPYGPVTEFMKNLVKSGQARPFHFSTPRGMTGFYKVSNSDFQW